MADTTTIATEGHFGTVTDRIVAIATQGYFLFLDVASFANVAVSMEQIQVASSLEALNISSVIERLKVSVSEN